METRSVSRLSVFIFFLWLAAGCTRAQAPLDPEWALDAATNNHLVVLTADYKARAGELRQYQVDVLDRKAKLTIAEVPVSSDPVLRTFPGSGDLFVVNRYGYENIQSFRPDNLTIDFPQHGFVNDGEFNLTPNLQDLVLLPGGDAYLSALNKTKLLRIDPSTGVVKKEIDLSAYKDDDGIPEMSQMVLVNGLVYLQLQRLYRGKDWKLFPWEASDHSSVLIIDPATDEAKKEIVLGTTNPFSTFKLGKDGSLYVASQWMDGDGKRGGIERIDPQAQLSSGIIISETTLGGMPVDLEMDFDYQRAWVIILQPDYSTWLVEVDLTTMQVTPLVKTDSLNPIKGLVYDPERELLFYGQRLISSPGVHVWDLMAKREKIFFSVGLPPEQLRLVK